MKLHHLHGFLNSRESIPQSSQSVQPFLHNTRLYQLRATSVAIGRIYALRAGDADQKIVLTRQWFMVLSTKFTRFIDECRLN